MAMDRSELPERGRRFLAEARDTGKDLADRAGQRARSRVEDARRRTVRELRSVANTLHGRGDVQSEESVLVPYVKRVADQMDRAVNFLETHTLDDLAQNVRELAQRRPALFLGGCFAAGILAARFLSASGSRLAEHTSLSRGAVGGPSSAYPSGAPPRMGDYSSRAGAMYSGPMRGTRSAVSERSALWEPEAYGDDFDAY